MDIIKKFVKKYKKELLTTIAIFILLIVAALVLKEFLLLFFLAIAYFVYYLREQNEVKKKNEAGYFNNLENTFGCYEKYFKIALISFAEELQLRPFRLGSDNFQIRKINQEIGKIESTMTFEAMCKNIILSEKRLIEYQLALAKSAEMLILTAYNEQHNKNEYAEHFVYTTIKVVSKNDLFIRFTINNNFIASL